MQGGYFTAKQARGAGYDYPHLAYHLRAGNFERVGHGLYRIPTIPVDPRDELIRLSLWSRDRSDNPLGVVSHVSALELHDLSDLIPAMVHLTVPVNFRKRAPRGVVLHRATMPAKAIEARAGFQVTTPLRTLLDVAADPSVPDDQLQQALSDALARGLVRRSVLDSAFARTHVQRLGELLARVP